MPHHKSPSSPFFGAWTISKASEALGWSGDTLLSSAVLLCPTKRGGESSKTLSCSKKL